MAEIKSTMEMVLERAAKMAAEAPETVNNEEKIRTGMRLAADFMAGKNDDLLNSLQEQPQELQMDARKGMVQILLRNTVLPRDEELRATSDRALHALRVLDGGNEVSMMLDELIQILSQYNQHKEQATQQLDDAIRSQLQQQAMAQGVELEQEISPARHPQYQEELTKLLTNLNGQYNDAMDQRKEAIALRFGISN